MLSFKTRKFRLGSNDSYNINIYAGFGTTMSEEKIGFDWTGILVVALIVGLGLALIGYASGADERLMKKCDELNGTWYESIRDEGKRIFPCKLKCEKKGLTHYKTKVEDFEDYPSLYGFSCYKKIECICGGKITVIE